MIYMTLYFISIFLHALAFWLGLKTLIVGSCLFEKTCVFDFHVSMNERKFIATLLSTMGNGFFIPAKISYVLMQGGNATGPIEPLWAAGHIFIAIAIVIYHLNAHEEIKNKRGSYERDF